MDPYLVNFSERPSNDFDLTHRTVRGTYLTQILDGCSIRFRCILVLLKYRQMVGCYDKMNCYACLSPK